MDIIQQLKNLKTVRAYTKHSKHDSGHEKKLI